MFCGEQTILASSNFGQVAAPVKCKRWDCPNCAEWRARCLQARGMEGKPNRFITFTCRRGQYASEIETARAMVKAWRTIVQRWRRVAPWHKCEYMAVFEPHKSGWPHMHILWAGHWIDQKWLSQQGQELLNSPRQDVRQIRNVQEAVAYVTKYFSKAPTKFGTCKRYWTSKGWPKIQHLDTTKAFHKGFPTELVNQRIHDIVAQWKRYARVVWTQPPDVFGWGCLWEAGRSPRTPRPPPWNHAFGFQVAKTRGNRAPLARGRGVRA